MTIQKIADGAYFVPSYSLDTLAGYQKGATYLGVSVADYLKTLGDVGDRALSEDDSSHDVDQGQDDDLEVLATP